MNSLETTLAYHQRTKHAPGRFARSLGFMDWDTQPDPFRAYEGAEVLSLERAAVSGGPLLDQLGAPGEVPIVSVAPGMARAPAAPGEALSRSTTPRPCITAWGPAIARTATAQ